MYLGAEQGLASTSSTFTPSDLPRPRAVVVGQQHHSSRRRQRHAHGPTPARPIANATLVGSDAPTYNMALGGVPAVSLLGHGSSDAGRWVRHRAVGQVRYTLFLRVQSFDNNDYPIMLTSLPPTPRGPSSSSTTR